MDITNMLIKIKEHRIYLTKMDSFDSLVDFILGYWNGYCDANNVSLTDLSIRLFPGFNEFVWDYYHDFRHIEPWYLMIRANTRSDQEAYEMFFRLYASYENLPLIQFDTLYLAVNNFQYMGIQSFREMIKILSTDFSWFFDEECDAFKDSLFKDFGGFVRQRLHDKKSNTWMECINFNSKSDKEALKQFLNLFKEYCDDMKEQQ